MHNLLEFIITSWSAFNTDVIFAVELKRQKKLLFRRKNQPSNQRYKRIGMFILLQSLYKLSLKSVISSPGSFVLMKAVTIAWISLSHSSDLHQHFSTNEKYSRRCCFSCYWCWTMSLTQFFVMAIRDSWKSPRYLRLVLYEVSQLPNLLLSWRICPYDLYKFYEGVSTRRIYCILPSQFSLEHIYRASFSFLKVTPSWVIKMKE